MTLDPRLAVLAPILEDRFGGIETGRMLRSDGLRTAGRFFAFTTGDDLVVRLPATLVAEQVVAGAGARYRTGNRELRGWLVVPAPDESTTRALVVAACDHASTGARDGGDFAAATVVDAPPAAVFRSLTTTDGIAGWWTAEVVGAPDHLQGSISLGFAGTEERILLVVEDLALDRAVRWRCTLHTGHPEWVGTTISFTLVDARDGTSVLSLRHHGLIPTLSCFDACRRGWEHFLPSLVGHASNGNGSPFVAARSR